MTYLISPMNRLTVAANPAPPDTTASGTATPPSQVSHPAVAPATAPVSSAMATHTARSPRDLGSLSLTLYEVMAPTLEHSTPQFVRLAWWEVGRCVGREPTEE